VWRYSNASKSPARVGIGTILLQVSPIFRISGKGHGTNRAASWSFGRFRITPKFALPLEYKGIQIAKGYVIDLLIEDSLIVEIKSVDKLLPIHSAQLMTYMRYRKCPLVS
jgi:hypothetical protein